MTRVVSGTRFGSAAAHFAYLFDNTPPGYVMFSDQDDVWLPFKVSRTLAEMRRVESECPGAPVLVHTDLKVVNGDLSPRADSFMRYSRLRGTRTRLSKLLIQNVVTGCTVMVNAPLCVCARGTLDSPRMRMHDWWLALAASAFGRVGYVPEATLLYRQHGTNSVGAKDASDPAYIAGRLKGGRAGELTRLSMEQSGAFADAFSRAGVLSLSRRDLEMCRAFYACRNAGRVARAVCYIRYGIYKCGAARHRGAVSARLRKNPRTAEFKGE